MRTLILTISLVLFSKLFYAQSDTLYFYDGRIIIGDLKQCYTNNFEFYLTANKGMVRYYSYSEIEYYAAGSYEKRNTYDFWAANFWKNEGFIYPYDNRNYLAGKKLKSFTHIFYGGIAISAVGGVLSILGATQQEPVLSYVGYGLSGAGGITVLVSINQIGAAGRIMRGGRR